MITDKSTLNESELGKIKKKKPSYQPTHKLNRNPSLVLDHHQSRALFTKGSSAVLLGLQNNAKFAHPSHGLAGGFTISDG